jgi:hypothetical protein
MALKDGRVKSNLIKIFPPKKDSENNRVIDRLHPKYNKPFYSILGKLPNIENAVLFLSRKGFPVKKISKELTNEEIAKINRSKGREIPNFRYIVELVATDKILADKELVNEILAIENLKDKKYIIYNEIKSGVVTNIEPDHKYSKYAKSVKVISRFIQDVANEKNIEDVTKLDKDEYKEFKNTVKTKIFEDILSRVKGPIMDQVSEISNEELFKEYLR